MTRVISQDSSGEVSARIAVVARLLRREVRRDRTSTTSARPAVDCGRRPTAAPRGSQSPMEKFEAHLSARSQWPSQIRMSFISGWVRRNFAATSCRATASTARATAEKRGRTSASRQRRRSHACESIEKILTSFMLPHSVIRMRRIRSAEFFDLSMAGRAGNEFSIGMIRRARWILRSIQTIQKSFTLRSGRQIELRGECRVEDEEAACFARRTVVTAGRRSHTIPECLAGSLEKLALLSRARIQNAFTQWSRTIRAAYFVPTTAEQPGKRRTMNGDFDSARSTTRAFMRIL